MPWKVYTMSYRDYPEYAARITSHYAGDMVVVKELGEISEEEVRKIMKALGINPEQRRFEMTLRDVASLPLEGLNEMLRMTRNVRGDEKIYIKYE